jgi:hypothetical protein
MRWAGHVKCMVRECIKIWVEKKLKRMDDLKETSICERLILKMNRKCIEWCVG